MHSNATVMPTVQSSAAWALAQLVNWLQTCWPDASLYDSLRFEPDWKLKPMVVVSPARRASSHRYLWRQLIASARVRICT